jgi:hypothetical protein
MKVKQDSIPHKILPQMKNYIFALQFFYLNGKVVSQFIYLILGGFLCSVVLVVLATKLARAFAPNAAHHWETQHHHQAARQWAGEAQWD